MSSKNSKCGYVAIIGPPNVGKSTLLNQILNVKLSIVTPKPQTTRKKVLGIYNSSFCQAIFLDTPGMLHPKYPLQEKLMKYVSLSIKQADIILLLLEPKNFFKHTSPFKNELNFLSNIVKPKISIINKIDTIEIKQVLPIINYLSKQNIFDDIVPISAKKNIKLETLKHLIEKKLPTHIPLYDTESITEQPERFFVSEFIREQIFKQFQYEIPYSTEVTIDTFREQKKVDYIQATILVERQSQKSILIGKNGTQLKKVGIYARKEIEKLLDRHVFLELFVKVKEKWRHNENTLTQLGY